MRHIHHRTVIGVLIALVATACWAGTAARAQQITADSLRDKPWQLWNAQEQEYGLGHYDQVYPEKTIVRAGSGVRKLETGPALSYFAEGGKGGAELEQFITEQRVAGMLVLQDGRIRLERYALGHTEGGLWTSQSVAKSVTSTLVGIAVREGYIKSLDDPVSDYIHGMKGSAYDEVAVKQLLTMTSGVHWIEDYTDPQSDLGRLYATAPVDGLSVASSYMRTLKRDAPPGQKWVYKTGETHLLGDLVRAATGKGLAEYLSEKIWIPYGMESDASWLVDETGSETAGCCLQARLRDFGRFGQFVLDGGMIGGQKVVPDNWFSEATSSQVRFDSGNGYGYQWWTLADGTYSAHGIYGQLIHIDPARRLVVVLSSAWPEAISASRHKAQDKFLASVKAALDREAGISIPK